MVLDQINYEKLLIPLNKFFDLHIGGSRRPVFFDIAATRPELLELDRNFRVIREELLGVLAEKRSIPRYHELDQMQYNISARVDPEKGLEGFPTQHHGDEAGGVLRVVRGRGAAGGIPGLFEAFFSILEGGKSIPQHEGPYRGYLRYHLGLVVPRRTRRRSDSRTRSTPGRKARACSSTTVGTTRSTTSARKTAWFYRRFSPPDAAAVRCDEPAGAEDHEVVYGRHVLSRLAALEAARMPPTVAQTERLEERTAAEGT